MRCQLVYRYEARWGSELCAVKVPHDLSDDGAARIKGEAVMLRELRHPCICAFFGFCRVALSDEVGLRPAIVMEHMAGGTLHDLLFQGEGSGNGTLKTGDNAEAEVAAEAGAATLTKATAATAATAATTAATAATLAMTSMDGSEEGARTSEGPETFQRLPSLSLRMRLAGNVADALAFLHAKGLAHRDVKGASPRE